MGRVATLNMSSAIKLIAMFWLLILLLVPHPAQARSRSGDEAAAVVQTWLQRVLVDGRQNVMIRQVDPVLHGDETVAYIVHLFGGGYCLAGADDLSVPVSFYAPRGDYDPSNPGTQYFLEDMAESLLALREAQATRDSRLQDIAGRLNERANTWSDLVAGRKPLARVLRRDRDIPDYVVLPLTSEWHQTSVFNDQCPYLDGPPHDMLDSKVGCVATAMSQIMYYWNWPNRGDGSRQVFWLNQVFDPPQSFLLYDDPGIDPVKWAGRMEWIDDPERPALYLSGYWDTSMYTEAQKESEDISFRIALEDIWDNHAQGQFRVVEGDFSNGYYDWDLMKDVHTYTDGVDAGDEEVAELCFHAGVAVDMNWGVYKSLASTSDVPTRMKTYFRYDFDMAYMNRDTEVMIDEIAWYRPVLIRGEKASGAGHAWVVFGYDLTGAYDVFMMNLGWGASSIGWYAIDDIFIDHYLDQKHVYYIAPEYHVRFVDFTLLGGDGTPSSPYGDLTQAWGDAPDGVTLILRAGRAFWVNDAEEIFDKPHVYKGAGVTISHN